MQNKTALTNDVLWQSLIIAGIADFLQLPLTLTEIFGVTIPLVEAVDFGIDIGVMIFFTRRFGFHWAFLPCFMLELVPLADVIPTWTAAVAFVAWQRKQEANKLVPSLGTNHSNPATALVAPPIIADFRPPVPMIQDAVIVTENPSRPTAWTPPPLPPHESGSDIDTRLERIAHLHERGLITEQDLNLKRQQILSEI